MNSRFTFFIFSLIAVYGCGVKAKPTTPPEKAINSYINSYTGTNQAPTLDPPIPPEKKKN